MTTDERSLATWLAARADVALADTFARRSIAQTAPWHDFFDAAAALLDATSVDRALARLPRPALADLAADAAGATRPLLEDLALVDGDGRPYGAVGERVAVARAATPDAFHRGTDVAAPAAADAAASAASAERILGATGALADLLIAAEHTPLGRTGTGAVSASDRRRLTDAGAIASIEELDDLVQVAAAAGLLEALDREWVVSDAGDGWLESSTTRRWADVVEGFRTALRPGLRTASGGYSAPAGWDAVYPLDAEWPDVVARLRRIAVRWGLVTHEGTEPSWASPLRRGASADAGALAALLPAEIDRVYLQADLSAISPGPLLPALDLRLRRIAVRESRAQASTYRFTADSLVIGMAEGETAEAIREFLSRLSLTGIPQPLEYLIASTSARYGRVRVRVGEHGNTVIESTDPGLEDAIEVDQALRPLGLVRGAEGLVTRVTRDVVYWSLADARYPVVAVGAEGDGESVSRRPARHPSASEEPGSSYGSLIARLRQTHGSDADAAWLGRELEQAVRSRSTIAVAVRLPDGSERAFTLEATGLGGGRLRGRDRGADIERTLPVSSIVSVRPA
jgi:hypothetical protein